MNKTTRESIQSKIKNLQTQLDNEMSHHKIVKSKLIDWLWKARKELVEHYRETSIPVTTEEMSCLAGNQEDLNKKLLIEDDEFTDEDYYNMMENSMNTLKQRTDEAIEYGTRIPTMTLKDIENGNTLNPVKLSEPPKKIILGSKLRGLESL